MRSGGLYIPIFDELQTPRSSPACALRPRRPAAAGLYFFAGPRGFAPST